MQLKHLTDHQLRQDTLACVARERASTMAVLEHIQEVHRRKLFAELGYPNLFKYLVQELKYTEGQAYRRIQAAKLVDQIPEVKNKIVTGSLNLTNASKLQSFFSETKLAVAQKLALLQQVEHKTTRECDAIIGEIKQPGSQAGFGFNLKLNDQQKAKWDKLAGMLAHQKLKPEEIMEKMLDLALQSLDPANPKRRYQKKKINMSTSTQQNRTIPAVLKRALYVRSQGLCEWTDSNGGRCQNNHALQIDHIQSFSLGGEATLQNLQLLCRSHHQRKTVKDWGIRKC